MKAIAKHRNLRPFVSLKDYVEWLCTEEGSDHFRGPTLGIAMCISGEQGWPMICNFVGKVENLQFDFYRVCKLLNARAVTINRFAVGSLNESPAGSGLDTETFIPLTSKSWWRVDARKMWTFSTTRSDMLPSIRS
jgi:hypothetical protein